MHDPARPTPWTSDHAPGSKADLYGELVRELDALFAGEPDPVANAANAAAAVFHALPELNWAGFHFLRGGELVLGPFQGCPACVRIALGQGVCGTAQQSQLPTDEAVMFADAVHPTHAARAVRCWAPKDFLVAITQSSERDRPTIHGAFDFETGRKHPHVGRACCR
jgi:hypothetical protein